MARQLEIQWLQWLLILFGLTCSRFGSALNVHHGTLWLKHNMTTLRNGKLLKMMICIAHIVPSPFLWGPRRFAWKVKTRYRGKSTKSQFQPHEMQFRLISWDVQIITPPKQMDLQFIWGHLAPSFWMICFFLRGDFWWHFPKDWPLNPLKNPVDQKTCWFYIWALQQ